MKNFCTVSLTGFGACATGRVARIRIDTFFLLLLQNVHGPNMPNRMTFPLHPWNLFVSPTRENTSWGILYKFLLPSPFSLYFDDQKI